MSKNNLERKPSKTAMFAALHRAIANKEFKNEYLGPDYLAENFLPSISKFLIKFKSVRLKVKKRLNRYLPGLHEYVTARTVFFDRIFTDALKHEIPQIVFLGAGYDTRAYRFDTLNKETKIFELDIITTQNRKKKCLSRARVDIPDYVTFVPVDFNRESLKEVLEKAGYDDHKKTLFLLEGVSYYLEPESVETTLEFVKSFSHEKSLIAFDYTISISEENISNYYGVKEFLETMKNHHPDELNRFAIDEGKIGSFLENRGLKLVTYLDEKEIENTCLLNEERSLIGQITGHFRFALASPGTIS